MNDGLSGAGWSAVYAAALVAFGGLAGQWLGKRMDMWRERHKDEAAARQGVLTGYDSLVTQFRQSMAQLEERYTSLLKRHEDLQVHTDEQDKALLLCEQQSADLSRRISVLERRLSGLGIDDHR